MHPEQLFHKILPPILRSALAKHGRNLEIKIKTKLGIPVRYNSPARIILEKTILPNLISLISPRPNTSKPSVLFVGCDWYTKHYQKAFFKQCEFWTIDPDINKTQYGSKNHHIIGLLEHLRNYFEPEYFDVIICNGVVGYGLNQISQAEAAFENCYICLRDRGKLIIGREDDPSFIPFTNNELKSLERFVPYFFQPLGTSHYSTQPRYNYHFSFLEKPPMGQNIKTQPIKASMNQYSQMGL